MEKQLGWACKLGGVESLENSMSGQTVLAMLMESQILHNLPPLGLFEGGTQKRDNSLCLPWCQVLQFLLVCDWCPSSCHSGAGAQREWVWVGESMGGFFKGNSLGLQKFLPLTQTPPVFAARSCGDLSSWHWNPGLGGLMCGWDSLLLRYPSQIYPPHMGERPVHSTFALLLPVSVDVVSLIP